MADSQPHRMEANIETLLDLEENLKQEGHSLENFPWVVQYNKRDLPGVEPVEVLEKRLNFLTFLLLRPLLCAAKGFSIL